MLRERVRKPSAFKQGMNGLFCPNLRQGVRVILIENERTARKLLSSFSLLYLIAKLPGMVVVAYVRGCCWSQSNHTL